MQIEHDEIIFKTFFPELRTNIKNVNMKKYYLLFSIALIGFLTSCNNFHIEKRHYRNGFYVNLNKNTDRAPEQKQNEAGVADEEENISKENEQRADERVVVAPVKSSEVSSPVQHSDDKSPAQTKTVVDATPSSEEVVQEPNQIDHSVTPNQAPGDADVMLIIQVILAIIIPPLAVYLKEGLTNRFWLVLILAILGGGFFFYPYFGGLWLVAVILALLIVLDVM